MWKKLFPQSLNHMSFQFQSHNSIQSQLEIQCPLLLTPSLGPNPRAFNRFFFDLFLFVLHREIAEEEEVDGGESQKERACDRWCWGLPRRWSSEELWSGVQAAAFCCSSAARPWPSCLSLFLGSQSSPPSPPPGCCCCRSSSN